MTTLNSTYWGGEGSKEAGIHYLGGYVNAGFSGGAIIFPTQEGWTVAGIITHREGVLKEYVLFRRNKETGELETTGEVVISGEPSGIIRFADIQVALAIIEETPSV